MIDHVCNGAACLVCQDAAAYFSIGIFPNDDQDAPVDAALERAAQEIAEAKP